MQQNTVKVVEHEIYIACTKGWDKTRKPEPAKHQKHTTINYLEILIKSNGVLVCVVEACHDSTLLVVTNTLLKEVCLASA